MKFTVEILTGLGNVLKSFVSALSIADANILPRFDTRFDADYRQILDSNLICAGPHEFGTSFVTARFLILKSEEAEQDDLVNDAKIWGDHPNIANKQLAPMFSTHSIDWFYDRDLVSDSVYERIQKGISKVAWTPEVLSEVDDVCKDFEGPVLGVQIRTWGHQWDPTNCINIQDGVPRGYNFETYKDAIDRVLPDVKTVFLTSDREDVLQKYEDYLKTKDVKVITHTQAPHMSHLQHSAASMLIGAKCDNLVVSRLSTFAECMWWFGGCKAKVIPLF